MGSIKFELTLTDLGQGKQLPFAAGSYNISPTSADLIVNSEVFTKMDPRKNQLSCPQDRHAVTTQGWK